MAESDCLEVIKLSSFGAINLSKASFFTAKANDPSHALRAAAYNHICRIQNARAHGIAHKLQSLACLQFSILFTLNGFLRLCLVMLSCFLWDLCLLALYPNKN